MARTRTETIDSFVETPKVEVIPLNQAELREFLSPIEIEVLEQINQIRKDPRPFITRIEEDYRAHLDEAGVLRIPGNPIVRTRDGVAAADDAINALREYGEIENPGGPLQLARGLILSAQDHVGDQWKDSESRTGHQGTDGSSAQGRGNRYGKWTLSFGESICYGERDPFRIVLDWILDDGIESRSNRKKILDPLSKYVGVAHGAHKNQGCSTVLLIVQEFQDDMELIENRDPLFESQYKSAKKRKFYSKNKTVTTTKTTGTRYNPNKVNCVTM